MRRQSLADSPDERLVVVRNGLCWVPRWAFAALVANVQFYEMTLAFAISGEEIGVRAVHSAADEKLIANEAAWTRRYRG